MLLDKTPFVTANRDEQCLYLYVSLTCFLPIIYYVRCLHDFVIGIQGKLNKTPFGWLTCSYDTSVHTDIMRRNGGRASPSHLYLYYSLYTTLCLSKLCIMFGINLLHK